MNGQLVMSPPDASWEGSPPASGSALQHSFFDEEGFGIPGSTLDSSETHQPEEDFIIPPVAGLLGEV